MAALEAPATLLEKRDPLEQIRSQNRVLRERVLFWKTKYEVAKQLKG